VSLRAAIAGLIVLATLGFVVGTTIERNTRERPAAEHKAEDGEETEAERAAEGGGEAHGEFQPFGVDIEAVPFIVLAAVASVAMAAAVWRLPRMLLVLAIVGVTMLLFAALDVREVVHQVDESRTGLAVLAGVVAALHGSAAATVAYRSRSSTS
jgi:opacity protein-like surface antigen